MLLATVLASGSKAQETEKKRLAAMAKGKAGEPVVSGQQAGKLAESSCLETHGRGRELEILACREGRGGLTGGMGHGMCVDCTGTSWKLWYISYDGGICDTVILCKC